MINTGVFDYINVLDKAADGAWLRNEAIANNIANVNTPGYKRQDVSFEAELKHALKANKYVSLDEKVKDLNSRDRLSHVNPRTYTDYAGFSYRLDAHSPEEIVLPESYERYRDLIISCDLQVEDSIEIIKP